MGGTTTTTLRSAVAFLELASIRQGLVMELIAHTIS
jgi:hypothetical protein